MLREGEAELTVYLQSRPLPSLSLPGVDDMKVIGLLREIQRPGGGEERDELALEDMSLSAMQRTSE